MFAVPVPGGCNLEFNFRRDPNIHTWYNGYQLWVQFQYASIGSISCDDSKQWGRLSYSVYALHFKVHMAFILELRTSKLKHISVAHKVVHIFGAVDLYCEIGLHNDWTSTIGLANIC